MLMALKSLSSAKLERAVLKQDKACVVGYGPCGLGKTAVYCGSIGLLRGLWYIPLVRVQRVYKRLAVTKGFFVAERRIFGTIPYFVICYDNGKTKVCRFKYERELDEMLDAFRKRTKIPVGKP